MSKRSHFKMMSAAELRFLQEQNWAPVSIGGAALPAWLSRFPREKLIAVYGSATYDDERIVRLGDRLVPHVIAGYDLFRYDSKDEVKGFPVNKDHYVVVRELPSDKWFLVIGPEKMDGDHWFPELPEDNSEIEIFELPDEDQ